MYLLSLNAEGYVLFKAYININIKLINEIKSEF